MRSHENDTPGPAEDEEGGITVLSLFLFLGMLMAAGLAVDFNNMVQSRAQLQGAADAAGHAALYWRLRNTEAEATDKAIEVARLNMPTTRFGNVLSTVDVEFGDWDSVDRTFTVDPGNRTAVRVTTRRTTATANPLNTFLMNFIGHESLDINAVSVWDAEDGFCPPRSSDKKRGEGFFALGIVDIQSNNTYRDGFCVHSDEHVEFQQGSIFEKGVTVSMPDERDLVIPQSGMDQNSGLEEALDSMSYNLTSFFNDLPKLIAAYEDPGSSVNSPMISSTVINTKAMKANVQTTDIVPNAINILTCNNKTITIDNNVVIRDAVVITDCEVKFNSGAAIENATLISTNTGSKAISAPSGFRVGAKTYCNDGKGGANLITMGDMTVSSGFEAYGANVVANGNINITSSTDGLGGINFLAGGRIDATSNGDMGFCAYGPPQAFSIPTFRMVL